MDAGRPGHDDHRALIGASERARQRGDNRDGAALARDAAVMAERDGQDGPRAAALALLAWHELRLGHVEAAVAAAQQALQHFSAHGPAEQASRVHGTLSAAYERAGLNALAMSHAAQAQESASACGDAVAECWALIRLGTALNEPQGLQRGLDTLERAVALARQLPDTEPLMAALNNLSRRWIVEADRLAAQGDEPLPALQRALAAAEESARVAASRGAPYGQATAAANLAGVHRRLGQFARARSEFGVALQIAQRHGYGGLEATFGLALVSMAFEQAPCLPTRYVLEQRLDADQAGVDPDLRLQARRALVQGCRAQGDLAGALAQMEQLHREELAWLARRSDLQARLIFNQAELDQARHGAERAGLEAEMQRLRADAEHRTALQLEREVAARTAELERARVAAEAANRAKSAFLATVGHELRTPLNGLIGMVELARRRAAEPRQADQLAKAAEAGLHLSGLLDDVLNYVAADAEAPAVPADTDLRALLAAVQQKMRPVALAKGLDLVVDLPADLPARMRLDGDRAGRVLEALVDNAVKFSSRGPVCLVARHQQAAGGAAQLLLEVIDCGPGLAPVVVERLFQPFEPGDASSTRAHGGLGLGLALVQRLVQSLGGEVGVHSRPATGSTFWVTLPTG